jgi:molybdate transport system ATP-binding protein
MSGERLSLELFAQYGALTVDINLEVPAGALVVVGPNGAGKSTFLQMILGTRPVQRGVIRIGADTLLDTSQRLAVPLEARNIGWVPQSGGTFAFQTVTEHLEFAVRAGPRCQRAAREHRKTRLWEALALKDLGPRKLASLSGGERQRVALVRALLTGPRALLLDEPLGPLDIESKGHVRSFFRTWLSQLTIPALVVTHDADDAKVLGDQVVVLEQGRIVQRGTWATIQAAPASAFAASLFAGKP